MQTARMSPIRPAGRIDERPFAVYVAGHDQNRTVICTGGSKRCRFRDLATGRVRQGSWWRERV